MEAINPAVVALVEDALAKDPTLTSKELRERATLVDESVRGLSGRQFHAKYALQARKRLATKSQAPKRPEPDTPAPALRLLIDAYEQKRAELNEALREAFQRALSADSVTRINELLTRIEREIEALNDS